VTRLSRPCRRRVREYFLARQAKKLATAWLVANIPPHILAIHPDKLSSVHLNALRLIVDKAWRDFDQMAPASAEEVEEWLYSHSLDRDVLAKVERTRTMIKETGDVEPTA